MTDRLSLLRPAAPAVLGALVAAVMAVTILGLYRWDNWFLNPDGAFYLSVVDSLLAGEGPRFPDGSVVALRGPAYASWLSAGWALFSDTTRTAIWASRSILILNAGLVVWATGRWGSIGSLVAGLLAAIGPLYLLAGGLFLVPDALAAGFVLVALIALQSDRPASAGMALGLALLAKETALLAVPALGVACLLMGLEGVWGRLGRLLLGTAALPAVWLVYLFIQGESAPVLPIAVIGAVAAGLASVSLRSRIVPRLGRGSAVVAWVGLVGITLVILSISVAALVPLQDWWTLFDREVRNQLFGMTLLWPSGIAIVIVLVGSMVRSDSDVLPALMVSGVGIAALIHAAVAGLGLRNGLLAGYGLALLTGRLAGSGGWRRVGGIAAAAVLLVAGFAGSEFVNGKFDAESLTWDAPPVQSTAAFLEEQAGVVVTTSAYGSWLAHLAPSTSFYLAPTGIVSQRVDAGSPSIGTLADWAGTKPKLADSAGEVIGVLRKQTISADRADLWRVIRETGATHVVVTGNASSAAASTDGGLWLVLVAQDPGLERRFASSLDEFPHWLVVYEVVGDGPPPPGPLVVYFVGDEPSGPYPAETSMTPILDFREDVLRILGAR